MATAHTWPTGCLVFDEDDDGNPVNIRKVQVVPEAEYKLLDQKYRNALRLLAKYGER